MNDIKRLALNLTALAVSVIPPLSATVSYFPLWKERGAEALLSGWSLILILIAAAPIFRFVKGRLRSPSAWCIWLALFILFSCLSSIAHEMKVISLIGFLSGLAGAFIFRIAKNPPSDN